MMTLNVMLKLHTDPLKLMSYVIYNPIAFLKITKNSWFKNQEVKVQLKLTPGQLWNVLKTILAECELRIIMNYI